MPSTLIQFIAIFCAGLVVGFILGLLSGKLIRGVKIQNSEKTVISYVVLMVWVLSVIVDIYSANYQTPFAIHGIFGAIVGYFYEQSLTGIFGGKK